MLAILLLALFSLAACDAAKPGPAATGWKLVVLGIAQDGGMPHPGCTKPPCSAARAGSRRAEKVACVGLVHRATGAAYLFDATPDFPAQLHALSGGKPPDAIFLTHAHAGHYTGLMYLGKEAIAASGVPVHATARMSAFLTSNGPWSLLVEDRRIVLRTLTAGAAVALPGGARVTALSVPHRDELSDTVGYLIEGPRAKALYIPDIDKWEKWDQSLSDWADRVDWLLVDGTFASLDLAAGGMELPL
jgi:pyrroloquinoline quinone biosynthesis protein B